VAIHPDWIERSKLWLVLDCNAAKPRSLLKATELCIEGGVDAVVFRMKDVDAFEALRTAARVRYACHKAKVPFVLAHFHELIGELQPDACHAGIADGPLPEIHYRLGGELALGYSAHSIDEAQRAIDEGADYLFLGPVFPTPSKKQYGEPLGLEVVKQSAALAKPVVLIGGMAGDTVSQAVAAGAKRVAAISALLSVPDPREAARQLRALLP